MHMIQSSSRPYLKFIGPHLKFIGIVMFAAIMAFAAAPSEARERHGSHGSSHGGHGYSSHSSGGYSSRGHGYSRHGGGHGFSGYSFFAGAFAGHVATQLYYRPTWYPQHYYGRTVYVTRPQVTVIRQPATVIQTSSAASGISCLQTREYQTTVIVGGQEVDAYGTACLQPDGAWSRGPAKLPPQYQ